MPLPIRLIARLIKRQLRPLLAYTRSMLQKHRMVCHTVAGTSFFWFTFSISLIPLSLGGQALLVRPAAAQAQSTVLPQDASPENATEVTTTEAADSASNENAATTADRLELPPNTADSPLLQEWLEGVPDVLSDIRHDPSFRTRIKAGYSEFPSSNRTGGFAVGVEDWFIGDTALTLSGDYQRNFEGNREAFGADLRYYVLPLGGYVNVAPVLGYRSVRTASYDQDGLNVGFQIKVIPARGGGADFAYSQTWLDPTGSQTVGTTQLEFGYALTEHLRLATEIEWQFAPGETDSRVGVGLEWML